MTSGKFWAHDLMGVLIVALCAGLGAAACAESEAESEDLATSEASLTHSFAAPSALAVTGVTATTVGLHWVDTNKDESGFAIERSAASSSAFAPIGQTGKDVTSYQDTSVTQGASYLYRVRAIKKGGAVSAYSNVASATIPGGAPTVMPTSFAFGNQVVGTTSASKTITITNPSSTSALSVSVPVFFGNDFWVVSNSMSCSSYPTESQCTLAPGASGTLGVVFVPSALGARTGTLPLGIGSTTVSVALAGDGVSAVNASSLAFGNQVVGTTSPPKTLTITNPDPTIPMTVSVPVYFGNDFWVVSNSMSCSSYPTESQCTLAPGASGTLGVAFVPSALGARSGTLSLGTGTITVSVALSGNGVSAVNVSSLAFGNQIVGTTSAPKRLTISNPDPTIPMTVSVPVYFGNDFWVTANSMSCSSYPTENQCTLAPGASGTLDIVFVPSTSGLRLGTLSLGTGSFTANVSLSGTGTTLIILP